VENVGVHYLLMQLKLIASELKRGILMALAAFFGYGVQAVTGITLVCDSGHSSELQFELWSDERGDRVESLTESTRLFKDMEHLIRLAVVMAIALTAFMILRAAVVHAVLDSTATIAAWRSRDRVAANCFCRSRELRDLPFRCRRFEERGKHAGVTAKPATARSQNTPRIRTLQRRNWIPRSLRPLP